MCTPEMTPSAVSSASRAPDRMSIVDPEDPLGERDEGRGRSWRRGTPPSRSPSTRLTRIVVAKRAVALERGRAPGRRLARASKSGRLHLAAESAQRLLVEQRGRTAGQPFVDDEADRVRANVDHGQWRAVVEAARCVGERFSCAEISAGAGGLHPPSPLSPRRTGVAVAGRNPSATFRVLTNSDWS